MASLPKFVHHPHRLSRAKQEPMTALGQTEKNSLRANVFRVTLKADIAQCSRHVSKVPKPEVTLDLESASHAK
jgi:hypothetical protein